MNRSRKAQIVAQEGTPIFRLKCRENVSRVHGRHHPKSALALDLQRVRNPVQITIA